MRFHRCALIAFIAACAAAPPALVHATLRQDATTPQSSPQSSAPAPQSPAASDDKLCTIAGNVVSANTGEPLRRAHIDLSRDQDSEDTPIEVLSDSAGHFEIDGVEPGRYDMTVYRDGYRRAHYGQMANGGNATMLALTPGQKMSDLVFRLWKLAVISGRIVDSNGDPVQRVEVAAVMWKPGRKNAGNPARRSATTDDRGEYRIFDLPPGRYLLAASPPDSNSLNTVRNPEVTEFRQTYYPQTADVARATLIEVKSGDEVTGMDMALVPASETRAYTVRGRVIDNTGVRGSAFTVVILAPRGAPVLGFRDRSFAEVDTKTGEFELRDISPGEYVLIAQLEGSSGRFSTHQNLSVVASDPESITLVISKGINLPARLTFEGKGAAEATNIRMVLEPSDDLRGDESYRNYYAVAATDGSFTFTGVNDGNYRVSVHSECDACYLKAAESNGVDLLARGVQVNEGVGPARIDIIYSSESGSVTGSVTNKDDLPAVGATVVLIPSSPARAQRREYHTAQTDQYGRFEVKGLAPGDYSAYALEQVDSELFNETDPMRSYAGKGESVSVAANARQSVDLKVIPAADAAN